MLFLGYKSYQQQHITTMGLEIVCNETGCKRKFTQIQYLRNHLISDHNQFHEPEQVIDFDSESEYDVFIAELHKQSVCFASSSTKHRNGREIKYLLCNRSGKSRIPTTTQIPKENYRKMGKHCTCTLTVTRKNGHITAKYFATHYNHELDKSHRIRMPISKSDREEVVTRLQMGVPGPKIRADFATEGRKLPKNETRTIHYVDRHGYNNIKRGIITNNGRLHQSDDKSVELWKERYPNFLIYLKFLGDIDDKYPVSILIIYYINRCHKNYNRLSNLLPYNE